MPDERCEQVRRWLLQKTPVPPPPALCEHVAGCARCRGALVVLLAELLQAPPPGDGGSCAVCERDLDAYISRERELGSAAALRRYPHVWWHLWFCQECAENYRLINVLLDAEAAGALRPVPAVATRPLLKPALPDSVRLERRFLHRVFAPYVALGTAWSDESEDDERILFTEERSGDYHLSFHARLMQSGVCEISVVVRPPVSGRVRISWGTAEFRTLFNKQGMALFEAMPLELLTDATGPDLLVTVESADEQR